VLVITGYWPPDIEFGHKELATVVRVLEEQNKT